MFNFIKHSYDRHVEDSDLTFRQALESFEYVSEYIIRPKLGGGRSVDQAWKSCKGLLYEYAVCRALDELLLNNPLLSQRIDIIHGSKLENRLRSQVVIRNWSDILPDVDFIVVNKPCNRAMAVISCKTSLRERITEVAFWSEVLKPKGIETIFVTIDKDEEITSSDINRYLVMHVLDYTIITDKSRYEQIVNKWKREYGYKEDFDSLIKKITSFNNIEQLLRDYAEKC